jgi:hypothetical protein
MILEGSHGNLPCLHLPEFIHGSESGLFRPASRFGRTALSSADFMRHMATELKVTRWLISKDAHVAERTPFKAMPDLLTLPFGIFDDSFYRAWKPGYNRTGGDLFGLDRWRRAPQGGEQLIDSADFARTIGGQLQTQSRVFHISFMIADQ